MSHEMLGLLGLAATLLGTVVASTWRFSALASKLLAAYEQQRETSAEIKHQLQALEKIPTIELRVSQLERTLSMIPRLENRVVAVEQAVNFSKEWRRLNRGSRPDNDGDD